MPKCDDCNHVEMCGWRKELNGQGCEFFEGGGWIPVSERLPKSCGVYIVSRRFTDGFDERVLTDACYFDGTSTWYDDNRINHDRGYVDKEIVAWIPLPEPYGGE